MSIRNICKLALLALLTVASGDLFAQNFNPFVAQGIINPAPIPRVEQGGVGVVSFTIGNSGTDSMPLIPNQEMILILTMSRGVPNHPNPIQAIGGSFASYFNWLYDPGTKTYQGMQNQTIPGALNGGTGSIYVLYKVFSNSASGNPQNGFNVNITPPAYSVGINVTADDAVSSFTWTEPLMEAVPDINQTLVNMPVSGSVLTNDNILPGSTYAAFGSMSNGSLTFNANGSYTYTPNAGFLGKDSVSYIVCTAPPLNKCDTATLTILVKPNVDTNSVLAQDDYATTLINQPIAICHSCNDSDPQANPQGTATILTNPANGTVVVNGNGTVTYTPTNNYVGEDKFSYQICDNGVPAACDTAFVFVNVVNISPIVNQTYATDDAYSIMSGTALNGNVTLNDTDPQNDPLSYALVPGSGPAHGTLTFNPDGSFTYTSNANYKGPDQFIYSKCDNVLPTACDTATVYVNVYLTTPVPVEMKYFYATPQDCYAELEWMTSQEINVSHFEIQRKKEAGLFEVIGTKKAVGNSNIAQVYSYKDLTTGAGNFEYRLRVVDIDGKDKLTESKTVKVTCSKVSDVKLFPNPASLSTTLLVSTPEELTYEVKLVDAAGKTLYYTAFDINNETKAIDLPIKALATGIYSVLVFDGTETQAIRFVKTEE